MKTKQKQYREVSPKAMLCRYCGTPVSDQYCPHCGQRVLEEERLGFRPFLMESMKGLFCVEGGFFYTLRMLLVKPWVVIRDYIHGERRRYTSPLSMMLSMLIYSGFFTSYFNVKDHIFSIFAGDSSKEDEGAHSLGDLCVDILCSQQVIYLMFCIPVVCGVYLTYLKYGSRRFNFTEYFVAAIYMLSMIFIYDIIYMFLAYMGIDFGVVALSPVVLLSAITLTKSFRVPNVFLRVLLLLLCVILVALCSMVFFVGASFIFSGGASVDISLEN